MDAEQKIITICAHCGKKYSLSRKWGGKKIKCKKCGQAIHVVTIESVEQAIKDAEAAKTMQPEQPVSASSKKKYIIHAAAVLCIAFVIYYIFFTAPQYQESKPVTYDQLNEYEKELAAALVDSLTIPEEKEKEIVKTVAVINQQGPTPSSCFPEVSHEQQRNINNRCRRMVRALDEIHRKCKKANENFINVLYSKNMGRELFTAYCHKYEDKYFDTWRAVWLKRFSEQSGHPAPGQLVEFLRQLSYWRSTDITLTPSFKPFMAKAVLALENSVEEIQTPADAMAILLCSYFLENTPSGRKIRRKALRKIYDGRLESVSLGEWARGAASLLEYIRLQKKAGRHVSMKLLNQAERISQDLGFMLEGDGCLPQLQDMTDRINFRETIYHAAEIFDREDFRFLANGGMMSGSTRPPSVLSALIKNRNICIMRSTWNICQYVKTRNDDYLGDESCSMTVDIKTGDMSFFGYNQPLLILRRSVSSEKDPVVEFKSGKEVDHLNVRNNTLETDIYFLKKYNTCVVREKAVNGKDIGKRRFLFYRSEINQVSENNLVSTHVRGRKKFDINMPYKQSGLVSVYSPESEFTYKKIPPSPEGCYWKAECSSGKQAEYIITAMPFYRGRYPQRYVAKYEIKTDKSGVYTILASTPRTIKNKGVKDKPVCSFKIGDKQLEFTN